MITFGEGKISLGKSGIPSPNWPVGHGYVMIPSDQDRDKYIQSCLKNNRIFIRSEDGNVYPKIYVDSECLERIEFPETADDLGSIVIWVNIPKHNIPVVVGVLDLDNNINKITKDLQRRIQKIASDGQIDIFLDAQEKALNFAVTSEVSGKGKININVINPDHTAEIEAYVKGIVTLFATKNFTIKSGEELNLNVLNTEGDNSFSLRYKDGEGLTIEDEFGNKIEMVDGLIRFNGGDNDGMVLVNGLVTRLNAIEDKLNSLIGKYNTHIHPATSGTTSPTTSQESTITPTNKSDVENTKITQ